MNFQASGSIVRCRFVKQSAAGTVAQQSTAGAFCVGISGDAGNSSPIPLNTTDPPYAAVSGQQCNVIGFHDGSNFPVLEIGTGGCSAGDRLASDANGKGVVTTTNGHWLHAVAEEAASAGELCKVRWIEAILYAA
jgi:hypothetical protein